MFLKRYDDYYYRRYQNPYSDRNWYYQPERNGYGGGGYSGSGYGYDDRSRYGGNNYNR